MPKARTRGIRTLVISKAALLNRDHDAILQTLDRAVETDDGQQLYYSAESFEDAKAWVGIPVIFAKNHPKPEDYDADPEAELARIKGRVVGEVKAASIANEGHKRLMGTLGVEDGEVEQGIANGEISLSTGMYARIIKDEAGGRTEGPVEPHHVLLFYEDRANLPRDLGTGILNKRKVEDMADDKKEDTKDVSALLNKISAQETELTNKGKEIETHKAALTAKDAEIALLNKQLADIKVAEDEAKWLGMKTTYIPPGMVAKPEDEKALRELLNKDPVSFISKVEAVKVDLASKGEQGVTNRGKAVANKGEELTDAELAVQMNKIGVPSIEFQER